MSTNSDNPGGAKRPLIDTLVHIARRATGVPTEPLQRQSVEAAVREFVLSPSGSRRVIAREVIAEAAAVIVADLVEEVPADSAPRKTADKPTAKPAGKPAAKPAAKKTAARKAPPKAAPAKTAPAKAARAPRKAPVSRG